MHVRCPHCHNPIEIVDDAALSDVECPSCGSSFSLVDDGRGTEAWDPGDIAVSDTESYKPERRTIGHFELVRQLGAGAFGAVWLANDTQLDRQVAVKVPRRGQLSPEESELFLREARSAAQLKHPNIVTVHEVGRENGQVYIVSDLVEGITLADKLELGPLSAREAVEIVATIAEAVHHAHEKGVVHRDLKPSNVMLDADGNPYVMDFGLAKREAGEITMTVEGAILGTPAYMSPEQAQGEARDADARSDVYSLGVILFECLTGELPFRGNKRMLLHQVIHDEPPSPKNLNNSIPRDLETICLKCLQKEPQRRYATAQELAADLQRWKRQEPIQARPVSKVERGWLWLKRRSSLRNSIAAVLVVVGCALVALFAMRKNSLGEQSDSAVAVMASTSGQGVPLAVKKLRSLPHGVVAPRLRSAFDAATGKPRLRLAYGTAALPEPPQKVQTALVAGIVDEATSNREVMNIVKALRAFDVDDAIKDISKAATFASENENWRAKARLAIVAWHLGDDSLARDMLKALPDQPGELWDPIQRTRFIKEFGSWSGDIEALRWGDMGEPEIRSGVCLALGGVMPSKAATEVWAPKLMQWRSFAPDSGTHEAADWALRQWETLAEPLKTESRPIAGRDWWPMEEDLTMVRIRPGVVPGENGVVRVRSEFWLGDREVTVLLFQRFVNDTKWQWKGAESFNLAEGDQLRPVPWVSWYDAVRFCNWLSKEHGFDEYYSIKGIEADSHPLKEYEVTANEGAIGFRLPSNSEWEFACRAMTSTRFCFGQDQADLADYGVFDRDSGAASSRTKRCNAWGFFDMHGNVSEWCEDRPGPQDLRISMWLRQRAIRGGGWHFTAERCGSSNGAFGNLPLYRSVSLGFRVAASAGQKVNSGSR